MQKRLLRPRLLLPLSVNPPLLPLLLLLLLLLLLRCRKLRVATARRNTSVRVVIVPHDWRTTPPRLIATDRSLLVADLDHTADVQIHSCEIACHCFLYLLCSLHETSRGRYVRGGT